MRKPKHSLTEAEQAELRHIFETESLPDRVVAERMDLSITSVRNYRLICGYSSTRLEHNAIVMEAMRDTSLSVTQAAKKCGINECSMGWLRRKFGVKSDVLVEAERKRAEKERAEQRLIEAQRPLPKKAKQQHRPALTFDSTFEELDYLRRRRTKVEAAMTDAATDGNTADYMRYAQEYSALTYRMEFCESRLRTNCANDGDSEGGQIAFWNGHANTAPEPIY